MLNCGARQEVPTHDSMAGVLKEFRQETDRHCVLRKDEEEETKRCFYLFVLQIQIYTPCSQEICDNFVKRFLWCLLVLPHCGIVVFVASRTCVRCRRLENLDTLRYSTKSVIERFDGRWYRKI